jgi:hypothetical protein
MKLLLIFKDSRSFHFTFWGHLEFNEIISNQTSIFMQFWLKSDADNVNGYVQVIW